MGKKHKKHKKKEIHLKQKVCLICEKPFKGRTQLCPTCNKQRKEVWKEVWEHPVSVRVMATIKALYPNEDVFSIMKEGPMEVRNKLRKVGPDSRKRIRRELAEKLRSPDYLKKEYSKLDHVPSYINDIFSKDQTKEFLRVEGDRLNPKIYYVCKRCKQEQCQSYDDLKKKKGHNCIGWKSSGEVTVEEYLKLKKIYYKTQRDTLECVNPRTNYPMPYDFELPEYRVIIEVQGEQHYKFIPYFHGSPENFEYQKWKDEQKKMHAEENGYQVLYINYSAIETGKYKSIIDQMLINTPKIYIEKENHMKPVVQIYTDGACSGNPGPGGWAAILLYKTHKKEFSGGEASTTNNRMELMAVIQALSRLKLPCVVELWSDSAYVIDGISKGWAKKWRANGWKRPNKKPALNPDLWERLLKLTEKHEVHYHWVKGHAANSYNNRCDKLAVAESRKFPA